MQPPNKIPRHNGLPCAKGTRAPALLTIEPSRLWRRFELARIHFALSAAIKYCSHVGFRWTRSVGILSRVRCIILSRNVSEEVRPAGGELTAALSCWKRRAAGGEPTSIQLKQRLELIFRSRIIDARTLENPENLCDSCPHCLRSTQTRRCFSTPKPAAHSQNAKPTATRRRSVFPWHSNTRSASALDFHTLSELRPRVELRKPGADGGLLAHDDSWYAACMVARKGIPEALRRSCI